MPRLSVYVDDDLHALIGKWGADLNLSAICAGALKEELEAAAGHRTPGDLLRHLRGPSDRERELMKAFGLADAVVCETPPNERLLTSSLGDAAAAYLDRTLMDNCVLAVGGGRQMWCVVRSLRPRHVRLEIAAIGVASSDPLVLHVHPNTLVTLLSVLYAPKSRANLVGWKHFAELWANPKRGPTGDPSYVVVGSCGAFSPQGAFSELLGESAVRTLTQREAIGDYAGVFLTAEGDFVDTPVENVEASLLSGSQLAKLSKRADARIVMVSGGAEKVPVMSATLRSNVCNVLVTDEDTARALLGRQR